MAPTVSTLVLVDLAVLHDHLEVPGGVGDQIDIFERIAVDQQKIGQRALLDDPELAGIRIALAGQSQQFGVGRRRHDQHFAGRVPAGERSEDRALPLGQCPGEQNVGAPRRLDLILPCQLVGPGDAGPDFIGLCPLHRSGRQAGSHFFGKRLRAQPHALV
ncbi:hypothetical protein NS44R_14650, partial [Mammaliicoccus sciuri]